MYFRLRLENMGFRAGFVRKPALFYRSHRGNGFRDGWTRLPKRLILTPLGVARKVRHRGIGGLCPAKAVST
jgi:hypothetical protein